jgi:hypothetical protein
MKPATVRTDWIIGADDHLTRALCCRTGYRPVGYSSLICFRCNVLQALFPLCQATPTLSFRVNP